MTPTVSIAIISHNYAQFLKQAIDSALAQTHEPVQVLVVDDGSTDNSVEIIRGYGKRLEAVLKRNEGNSSAVNAIFPKCTGEIVMFLDADDFLYPDAVSHVISAWDDCCAKVQFRLSLVDLNGAPQGIEPPACATMPAGDVVREIVEWGHYVTPVLTGNAFRRSCLDKLLPIPSEPLFRNHNDGYMNPMMAFHGPVVSIDEELGAYRLHGANQWAYTSEVNVTGVRMRFEHELVRERYMHEIGSQQGRALPASLMLRNSNHIVYRLVSLKLDPTNHPVPEDSLWLLLLALPRALFRNPELDTPERLFTLLNSALIVLLPHSLAHFPVDWSLASRPHPSWLRALARFVRSAGKLGLHLKERVSPGR